MPSLPCTAASSELILAVAKRTQGMKTPKIPSERPRNPVFVAMMKRHGSTTSVMKHRSQPRGGNRNKQRDFLSGNY